MAYATPEQLAQALRLKSPLSPETQALLDGCLAAAAEEIDTELDRAGPLPDPAPASVVRTNVNRAVEWYKANDNADGLVGSNEAGNLTLPADGFRRHAATISAHKEAFGVA